MPRKHLTPTPRPPAVRIPLKDSVVPKEFKDGSPDFRHTPGTFGHNGFKETDRQR